MWEAIAPIALILVKYIFEKIAGKKLTDQEFADHIKKHQDGRRRSGKSAIEARQAREDLKNSIQ